MNNIVKLQRQYALPLKIFMALADVCILFLAVLLSYWRAWSALNGIKNGVLLLLAVIVGEHIMLFLTYVLPAPVRELPQSVLTAIDEECMTGLQCGNGILCKSGYLLIVGVRIKVLLPRDVGQAQLDDIGRGRMITIPNGQDRPYRIMCPASTAKGNGTFRQVDIDTFFKALMEAHYRDFNSKCEGENPNEFQKDNAAYENFGKK